MRMKVAIVALAVLLTGCGGKDVKPAGPDVRGMNLVDAEKALDAAKIGYSEHAKDGLMGILVKSNWVVCSEKAINPHMVRLEAAKRGC